VRRAGVALVATWAVTTARAADVNFRPTLSFGVFHDGNISVTGENPGDENAMLALDLAVDSKTPMTMFSFSYRPTYVAYRTATDLNYFGNTVSMGFSADTSRDSHYAFDLYLSRTDYQGLTPNTTDQATAFVPRTTLTQGSLKVSGTHGAGRRGFFDWQLRGGADRYKDLEDNPATPLIDPITQLPLPPDPVDFNDSTTFGGRIAWRGELSERNTLGIAVDAAYFGYELTEITPNVLVASAGLVGTSRIAELWMIDYAVGASRATTEDDSISGFSFNATIEYEVGRASTFSAGARQVFAPGTGLGGSTQDRGVWLAFAHTPVANGLSGSVLGGYWQRDELQFGSSTPATGAGDTESFNLNGTLGWEFNRYISVNAAYAYIYQRGRNVESTSLDTNYSSYGLYLRWTFRGR
jgi:hypothetical protein